MLVQVVTVAVHQVVTKRQKKAHANVLVHVRVRAHANLRVLAKVLVHAKAKAHAILRVLAKIQVLAKAKAHVKASRQVTMIMAVITSKVYS